MTFFHKVARTTSSTAKLIGHSFVSPVFNPHTTPFKPYTFGHEPRLTTPVINPFENYNKGLGIVSQKEKPPIRGPRDCDSDSSDSEYEPLITCKKR